MEIALSASTVNLNEINLILSARVALSRVEVLLTKVVYKYFLVGYIHTLYGFVFYLLGCTREKESMRACVFVCAYVCESERARERRAEREIGRAILREIL